MGQDDGEYEDEQTVQDADSPQLSSSSSEQDEQASASAADTPDPGSTADAPEAAQDSLSVSGEPKPTADAPDPGSTADAPEAAQDSLSVSGEPKPTADEDTKKQADVISGSTQARERQQEFPAILLPLAEARSLERVYVVPRQMARVLEEAPRASDRRIFFVCGKPNSGRYASALRLAVELSRNAGRGIWIYQGQPSSGLSGLKQMVQDLVRHVPKEQSNQGSKANKRPEARARISQGNVLIVTDALATFKLGLAELDDSLRLFKELEARLESVKVFLILVVEGSEAQLRHISSELLVGSSEGVDMLQVFDRHLEDVFPPILAQDIQDTLLKIRQDLLATLSTPGDVRAFMLQARDRLSAESDSERAALPAEAQKLAEELMGRSKRTQTRQWFESLTITEKLYAMFAWLFKGLDRYTLNDLYDGAVRVLRDNRLLDAFTDPRILSDELLWDRTLLSLRLNSLELNVRHPQLYEDELRRQVANHYRLLSSLMGFLLAKMDEVASKPTEGRWYEIIAVGLGRLCGERVDEVRRLVDAMAMRPANLVSASAGDLLASLAQSSDNQSVILDLLDTWIDDKKAPSFNLLWTGINAIGKLYRVAWYQVTAQAEEERALVQAQQLITPDELLERLQKFAERIHQVAGFHPDPTSDFMNFHEQSEALFKALLEVADPLGSEAQLRESPQFKQLVGLLRAPFSTALLGALADVLESILLLNETSAAKLCAMLRDWLSSSETLATVAHLVVNWLFGRAANPDQAVVDDRYFPLLDLLPQVLQISAPAEKEKLSAVELIGASPGDVQEFYSLEHKEGLLGAVEEAWKALESIPIRAAAETMTAWYPILESLEPTPDNPSDDVWRLKIYPRWLSAVNEADHHGREALISALIETWLSSSHDTLRRTAMALLTRARVLEGVVMDIPIQRFGLLLVDASRNANDDYLTNVFQMAQRLATLTPLHIHHLGRSAEPLILGHHQAKGDVTDLGTLSKEMLSLGRPQRSLLMLPPLERAALRPEQVHFILLLNTWNVLDLGDFLDQARNLQQQAQQQKFDPFAPPEERKTQEDRQSQLAWPWEGKVYLVVKNRLELPDSLKDSRLARQINLIEATWEGGLSAEALAQVERRIQAQIARSLHRVKLDEALEQLKRYRGLDVVESLDSLDGLASHLQAWLSELDNILETIPPRDVTLAIAWGIILLARHDLPRAVEQVLGWLKATDAPTRRIGLMASKLLLNFYSVSDFIPDPDTHAPLLDLIEPCMAQGLAYAEFVGLFQAILAWAVSSDWSNLIIGSTALRAIRHVRQPKDADALLTLVNRREALMRLEIVFSALGKAFEEFVEIIPKIFQWLQQERQRQERQRHAEQQHKLAQSLVDLVASAAQQGIRRKKRVRLDALQASKPIPPPVEVPSQVLIDLSALPPLSNEDGEWVIRRLREREELLLDRRLKEERLETLRNLQPVLDAVRLQLYVRSGTTIPPLPQQGKYGLILLDASQPPDYLEFLANVTLKVTSGLLEHPKASKLVPIIYRLGRSEVVFSAVHTGRRQKIRLRAEDLAPKRPPALYAPLMGDVLSRYSPDSVGFVLIISSVAPIDLNDWLRDDAWSSKVWIVHRGQAPGLVNVKERSMPDDKDLKEPINHLLEDLIQAAFAPVSSTINSEE